VEYAVGWRHGLQAIGLFDAGRRALRDYYERRGVQINGAWRLDRHVELLFAWRGERESPLPVESGFSLFNRDDKFRSNAAAQNGRLNAVVIGASIDGTGFEQESLEATYRRHQLESAFGDRLPVPEKGELAPIWRVDWTSEISAPDAFSSDFDFRRHIVSGRLRTRISEFQDVGARAIGGWSEGVLPPQREFAVGGIGSVHGYAFKESIGDTIALLNVEYAVGWRHGLQAIGFFDAGRTTSALRADSPWLKGVGFGFAVGDVVRLDFGYKVEAIPSSLQVLLRFGRTF
jgi:outer membrane translocation and assembly module TamA